MLAADEAGSYINLHPPFALLDCIFRFRIYFALCFRGWSFDYD